VPYNIEKPLWVFVGASVTKVAGSHVEKATVSDVGKILAFLSAFLKSEEGSADEIERILTGNAEKTGLLDEKGGDIFAGGFVYLQQFMLREKWTAADLFRDILDKVFQNRAGGELSLARIMPPKAARYRSHPFP
jgi:hypothetical protein